LKILFQFFQVGDNVTNLHGSDRFIVLAGGTGTGKSTLSKFLRKTPTLRISKNVGDDLVFTDNEDRIGNNNSLQ
jgi:predicted ATPase